jgi:hypothetical protein
MLPIDTPLFNLRQRHVRTKIIEMHKEDARIERMRNQISDYHYRTTLARLRHEIVHLRAVLADMEFHIRRDETISKIDQLQSAIRTLEIHRSKDLQSRQKRDSRLREMERLDATMRLLDIGYCVKGSRDAKTKLPFVK